MTAQYLIRLDDACPTMNPARWTAIERMLADLGIRPLVAVVPDNRDPSLAHAPADPHFWDRVRQWEADGWTIAMHGLHHVYHPVDRRRLILPFYDRSEFAGLDMAAQRSLIAKSWSLFVAERVHPTAWIAPSHSFDRTTVGALAEETPIRLISDGLSIDPFSEDGFTWIPQQLWGPAPRRRGVWTICLHPDTMSDDDIERLRRTLAEPYYRTRLAGLADLSLAPRRRSTRDRAYRGFFMARHHAVPVLLPFYQAARRLVRRVRR